MHYIESSVKWQLEDDLVDAMLQSLHDGEDIRYKATSCYSCHVVVSEFKAIILGPGASVRAADNSLLMWDKIIPCPGEQ